MASSKTPATKKRAATRAAKKPTFDLNLALQGGGAHGAFTWGVLDRLLDEEDIHIKSISGTSAGAMNAAVLIDGYNEGGRAKAKAQLREFWFEISVASGSLLGIDTHNAHQSMGRNPLMDWLSALNPMDIMTRVFSPYEYNPLNYNPLRDVLERIVNVDRLHDGMDLFVTATNVETGEARVFRDGEITIDVLLASACLPFVYQAVEIDGVPYWDGGYMGNPAIWPLIYQAGCADVLLVQINPLHRAGTPKNAVDIVNRVNEISFNSSLIAEMRAIHFVQKLIEKGKLSGNEYSNMRMHRVLPPMDLREMNAASKMNMNWDFLISLHSVGYQQMDAWLKENKKHIGKQSTLDIEQHFLKTKAMNKKQKVAP